MLVVKSALGGPRMMMMQSGVQEGSDACDKMHAQLL